MAEVKHGTVSVTVPDRLVPPDKAGKMSRAEVRRLLKAPHGLGQASEDAAYALERAGASLSVPEDLTPEALREAGALSEEMSQVILDLEVVLHRFRQGSLLRDYDSHKKLRRLNDLAFHAGFGPGQVLPRAAGSLPVLLRFLCQTGSHPEGEPKAGQKRRVQ